MEQKPKVLLTYIESGMGHITSMQSIKAGLQKYADVLDIKEDFIMHHSTSAKIYEKFITRECANCVKHPLFGTFMFWFFDVIGGIESLAALHHSIFYVAYHAIMKHFEEEKPAVIISTHYFVTYVAVRYRMKHDPNCIVITYNPDNNVHMWWDGREGLFLVNNETARQEAINKRKFDPERVINVGFSKRKEVVDCTATKEELRDKYNLPKDKFTVLLADGAYAVGRSKDFCRHLLWTKKDITIIYLAGKNIKKHYYFLKKKAKLEKKGRTNIDFRILEFTPKIYEYYKACDLVITKAGPNTLLDCCLVGTPFIANLLPQPMEKAAYQLFVKDKKCGMGVFRDWQIQKVVEHIIDCPETLDEYKENMKYFQNMPNGVEKISQVIESELKKQGLIK